MKENTEQGWEGPGDRQAAPPQGAGSRQHGRPPRTWEIRVCGTTGTQRHLARLHTDEDNYEDDDDDK